MRRSVFGFRVPMWSLCFAGLIVSMGAQSAKSPSIPVLLDTYSRTDFSAAVRAGASLPDLVSWRKSFPVAARAWIDSVPEQRDRRRLVAAGLVLEVVRERYERDSAVWLPLRDVLEWACGELRETSARSPGEQAWHRASVALATRARDWPWLTDGLTRYTSAGPGKKPNDHASHGRHRFPSDSRFALSVVVARTSHVDTDIMTRAVEDELADMGGLPRTASQKAKMIPNPQYISEARLASLRAIAEFTPFLSDIEVGSEAEAHVSHMSLMIQDYDRALEHALAATKSAKNTNTKYLGFVLAGLSLDGLRDRAAAQTAYANALQVLPGGDTAALLRAVSRPSDESPNDTWSLVEASLESAKSDDPYRRYHYGDYWQWSTFISRVHEALR